MRKREAVAEDGAEPLAGTAKYSWQQPHARVIETGDLAWAPAPFRAERGESVRFIDFAGGNDANDGLTRATAWRHHPWDPAAIGNAARCRGIHTYLFKKGTIYRGTMVARDAGEPGNPIRLTIAPDWGEGEAVIQGSDAIDGGWTRGAGRDDIPEPDRVWWRDLDFAPRNLWVVGKQGEITRMPLSRTPNWKVSDPDDVKSEWWHWNNEGGRNHGMEVPAPGGGDPLHFAIDRARLVREKEYYQDAIVWTEYGWVQSTPYPTRVQVVDMERRGLGFGGQWSDRASRSYTIVRGCRYYLEDKPQYLDDPDGEFWFDRREEGGRLYLRPPGGADPNGVRLEAARHPTLIDATELRHVRISGLSFRFTNVFWDLTATEYDEQYRRRYELNPACIRLVGSGTDLSVTNCRFDHTYMAAFFRSRHQGDVVDRVVVADNDLAWTDGGGIYVGDGAEWGHRFAPDFGRLGDVKVMRNRLREVGRRPSRYGMGVAIDVSHGETVEVAGNMLDRCWGLGINLRGGKRGGAAWEVPLARHLVHHNRVIEPLLNNNDFGGIETWQGGPFYVYNNVVGNPGGFQHWNRFSRNPDDTPKRFGFAYYLDGAYQNYLFNNLGWGKCAKPGDRLGNRAALQEIHSFQNTFFNNTFYNFVEGSRRQAPRGGRNKYLGNVWDTIGDRVFRHADPAATDAAANAPDAGPAHANFALTTNAYRGNVFHDVARYAVFKPSGQWHETLAEAQAALRETGAIETELGVVAEQSPLRDAPGHDFRPLAGSAVVGRGAKVFVPWGLSRVVGEWHFYPDGADPTLLRDEHWHMTPYHVNREGYPDLPRFPLQVAGATREDYVDGPLEDWTKGALRFDGKRHAVAANAAMNGPLAYSVSGTWTQQGQVETRVAQGEDFKSPQVHTSNLLVEIYFRTEPGHAGGVLVEKRAGAGYSLVVDEAGRARFWVGGGGSVNVADLAGATKVNDGQWHHLVAEADRRARTLTLYVDGQQDASGSGPGDDVSLANGGDLHVGGTPDGRCLAGDIDFLRLAHGTLADAKTTIEELHAWQFNGPFLRDFLGREPRGRRDAGAMATTTDAK